MVKNGNLGGVQIGIHEGVPSDVYHGWNAVSSSWLKTWLDSSPAHAQEPRDADTPAFRLGTAIHARILEPQAYVDLVAVQPECDRRTSVGKAIYQDWLETVGKRTVIDADQQRIVEGISERVWSMKSCRNMLDACTERELSIVSELHGTVAKARLDMYDPESGVVLDVKSHGTLLKDFGRAAFNLNYCVQLAHYRAVAQAAGLTVNRMGFLVCETRRPFGCQVLMMPNEAIDMADAAVERGCEAWRVCHADGWFPAYKDEVVELTMPAWAQRQMEGTADVVP